MVLRYGWVFFESAMTYCSPPARIRMISARVSAPSLSGGTALLIAQGYRPGNFRPIAEMEAALSEIMKAKGVEVPPAPKRKEDS